MLPKVPQMPGWDTACEILGSFLKEMAPPYLAGISKMALAWCSDLFREDLQQTASGQNLVISNLCLIVTEREGK